MRSANLPTLENFPKSRRVHLLFVFACSSLQSKTVVLTKKYRGALNLMYSDLTWPEINFNQSALAACQKCDRCSATQISR